MSADAQHSTFRGDIQGLRAIAVLSVVLYHAGFGFLSGGFVGVDIFFVISGYLIAGILLGEMQREKFSLLAFYERRVRRLFPALFVVLAAVLAAGAILLPPSQYNELGRTTFSTIFFVSNFDFFLHSGYFDADAQSLPLLHTWSLAVEEQFYIFFPLLLLGIFTFARQRLRLILALCALASLIACEWMVGRNAPAAFFLAPFRAFELLMGAAIAGLPFPARTSQGVRDGLSLAGLALIAAGLFLLNDGSRFPGLSALAPCMGTALVLFAGAGGNSAGGKLISFPAFTFVGALSYSLYLWHWPIFVFARFALLREPTMLENAGLILAALAAAAASWRWVEQPFLKRRGMPWRAIGVGVAAMFAGALVAAIIAKLDGLPNRFSPPALAIFAQAADSNPERARCHNQVDALRPYAENCTFGADGAAPSWAMWADSHGTELVVALGEQLAAHGQSAMEITGSACPPALDFATVRKPLCGAQNQISLDGLIADENIETVVLAVNYVNYQRADWPPMAAGFTRAVEALTRAGKRVILIYPIPVFTLDAPAALGLLQQRGQDPGDFGISRAAHDRANRDAIALLDALAARTHALVVRPTDIFCDERLCRAFGRQASVLYFNRDHLSLAGARLLTERIPLDAQNQRAFGSD
jgi:peptidoglycan/LPS O-acetylase OafA/YrhL